MFAFGFVADVDGPPTTRPALEALLDGWPYAPPQSRHIDFAAGASAGVLGWPVSDRDSPAAPIRDAARGLLACGDVRLYNRGRLKGALGVPSDEDPSDLALAFQAYLRWGPEMARHLSGDFALAIWDDRARSLFAVRDHLGVRPLFYRTEGSRIWVATDVSQIVRAVQSRLTLDSARIAEYFGRTVRRHSKTFFEDVCSLRPGHQFWFERRRLRTERHWEPPAVRPGVDYRDECDEIRSLFVRAVRERLDSTRPIVAHSSGGFDSSAIVMVAEATYALGGGRPPLMLASALTPGMPSDDSPYMEEIARRVRFEGHVWNALDGDPIEEIVGFCPATPEPGRGMGGGAANDLRLVRDIGAGVLLTGLFGDSVLFSYGITRDLARHGRWLELVIQAAAAGRIDSFARTMGRASLGFLPPGLALRALRRWNGRSSGSAPVWMGPRLRAVYPLSAVEGDASTVAASHMTTETWSRLTDPAAAAVVTGTVLAGARVGTEVRIPFLDVELVDRILQIPWNHRYPRGNPRRLGWDALGEILPRQLRARPDQGSWAPVFELHARRLLPALRRLTESGEWRSSPFVDKSAVVRMLSEVERGASSNVRLLAEFAIFESWLRYLARELHCEI